MRANADTKTQLLEHLRIAETMMDAIYQLCSTKSDFDKQTKQTLIYWSTRAKAALRDAKATVEGGELDATSPSASPQDET